MDRPSPEPGLVSSRRWPRLGMAARMASGMPPEMRATMPRRGQRLDETKPGSGLGLSIVADLAALYRGELRLEQASLGGLRAVLELPGDGA